MGKVRIAADAGFAEDRVDTAQRLVELGDIDFLVFECLAERTIALAQLARTREPSAGFDEMLAERIGTVLRSCRSKGVRIVTNGGAASPPGAGLMHSRGDPAVRRDWTTLMRQRAPDQGDKEPATAIRWAGGC